MTKKEKEAARLEAAESLSRWLKPGARVYLILRKVSASGMSRRISPIVFTKDGQPIHLGYNVARLLGLREDDHAVRVDGCGMDMGFHLVEGMSYALYKKPDALRHVWL